MINQQQRRNDVNKFTILQKAFFRITGLAPLPLLLSIHWQFQTISRLWNYKFKRNWAFKCVSIILVHPYFPVDQTSRNKIQVHTKSMPSYAIYRSDLQEEVFKMGFSFSCRLFLIVKLFGIISCYDRYRFNKISLKFYQG